jgi:hypothetical protein
MKSVFVNRSVSSDIDLLPSQMMHIPQSARVIETACSDDGGTDIRTPSTYSEQQAAEFLKKILPVSDSSLKKKVQCWK